MSRAFVFPGQGSQAVGMGVDLAAAFPVAREVFQEVDEALKQSLSKLMREGPRAISPDRERAAGADGGERRAVRVLEKEAARACLTWRPSSPATRWASTRRWPRPALRLTTPRDC